MLMLKSKQILNIFVQRCTRGTNEEFLPSWAGNTIIYILGAFLFVVFTKSTRTSIFSTLWTVTTCRTETTSKIVVRGLKMNHSQIINDETKQFGHSSQLE